MEIQKAIQQIISVHGGQDFWNRIEALQAEISTSGLLFRFKRRPVLDHVKVTAYAHEPRFVFHDFPSPGLTGALVGDKEVHILSKDGDIIQKRKNLRVTKIMKPYKKRQTNLG